MNGEMFPYNNQSFPSVHKYELFDLSIYEVWVYTQNKRYESGTTRLLNAVFPLSDLRNCIFYQNLDFHISD